MRRKYFNIFLSLVLLLLVLAGCADDTDAQAAPSSAAQPPVIVTGETTSRGTPIVDTGASEFDPYAVEMFDTPESSCFSEVGYDSYYEILVVTFRDSGATYLYLDFPEDEWDCFIDADSLGGYYNSYIKGNYECDKVG
ncbi:MAG: KTSC domain-containing protein [Clostridia bacterium]|nr:KTSC domain-containing protein [Clostridia bacterium]